MAKILFVLTGASYWTLKDGRDMPRPSRLLRHSASEASTTVTVTAPS
jgi:hypothetical protein